MRPALPFIASMLLSMNGLQLLAASPSKVSSSSLNPEQMSVYRDLLAQWRSNPSESINVADLTFVLEPDDGDFNGCMKEFPHEQPLTEVHRFAKDFEVANHVSLVDPKDHKILDPMDQMRQGEPVESAVRNSFDKGILYLSEVVFDRKHKRAAVRYGFVCGGLCGSSETVVLEKHRGETIEAIMRFRNQLKSVTFWTSFQFVFAKFALRIVPVRHWPTVRAKLKLPALEEPCVLAPQPA